MFESMVLGIDICIIKSIRNKTIKDGNDLLIIPAIPGEEIPHDHVAKSYLLKVIKAVTFVIKISGWSHVFLLILNYISVNEESVPFSGEPVRCCEMILISPDRRALQKGIFQVFGDFCGILRFPESSLEDCTVPERVLPAAEGPGNHFRQQVGPVPSVPFCRFRGLFRTELLGIIWGRSLVGGFMWGARQILPVFD